MTFDKLSQAAQTAIVDAVLGDDPGELSNDVELEIEKWANEKRDDTYTNRGYNACPICGYNFEPVEDVNTCPTSHYGEQTFGKDRLIHEDSDYMWCE